MVKVQYVIFGRTLKQVLLVRRGEDDQAWLLPELEIENCRGSLEEIRLFLNRLVGGSVSPRIFPVNIESEQQSTLRVTVAVVCSDERLSTAYTSNWILLDEEISRSILGQTLWDIVMIAYHALEDEVSMSAIGDISSHMRRASDYVAHHLNNVNGVVGWDHHLTARNRVGVIGTALGLSILQSCGSVEHFRILMSAADSLIAMQHGSGGWGTRSIQAAGLPIVHSSAQAVLALKQLDSEAATLAVNKGRDWLERCKIDGAWGIDVSASRPSVTATTLAVLALHDYAKGSKSLTDSVDWIIRAQHRDGGWGAFSPVNNSDTTSTAAHTGRALYTLLECDTNPDSEVIRRGVEWLVSSVRDNGVWDSTAESWYTNNNESRLEFKHAGLQWGLIGLLRASRDLCSPLIIRGTSTLVAQQSREGIWDHELAPGQYPIWATADSVMFLNLLRQRLTLSSSCANVQTGASGQLLEQIIASWKCVGSPLQIAEDTEKGVPNKTAVDLDTLESAIDTMARRNVQIRLWLYIASLVLVWLTLIVVTLRFGWGAVEPWTFFLGIGWTVGSLVYFAITKRELSPRAIYDSSITSRIRKLRAILGVNDISQR